MDTEGNRMSSTHDMEADRLAHVKLSCATEPGDLRVTGRVTEAGAGKILGYLAAATRSRATGRAQVRLARRPGADDEPEVDARTQGSGGFVGSVGDRRPFPVRG